MRTNVNRAATLQSLHPLIMESFEVQVIDVSNHGMGLRLRNRVAVQSEVKIRCDDTIVFGEVRYCVPDEGGFRAGIKIKETFPTHPPNPLD